jgi:peptide chain release factor 2
VSIFDQDLRTQKILTLEEKTKADDFWSNQRAAQKIIDEINALKNPLTKFSNLKQKLSDLEIGIELLSEKNDPELLNELTTLAPNLNKEIEHLQLELLLSGTYDNHAVVLSINAGAGGTDAQDWAGMLLRMYQRFCEQNHFQVEVVDFSAGEEAGIKGVTMIITGPFAYGYLKNENGVHRLVRLSPFNADHKRQTSFAAVDVYPHIEEEIAVEINPADLRIDTYRASGAGGQHVNKTDSAVRITHLPTKLVVACQSQRSQAQNKATAMALLKTKLMRLMEEQKASEISALRNEQKEIAWGNQIRSYVFHPYQLVKDHRTDFETSQVQKVMDGDLEDFMSAMLKSSKKQEFFSS